MEHVVGRLGDVLRHEVGIGREPVRRQNDGAGADLRALAVLQHRGTRSIALGQQADPRRAVDERDPVVGRDGGAQRAHQRHPARARRIGVQPRHRHPVPAHVAAELERVPELEVEPVQVRRRHGAERLDERSRRLVAALPHDVVGLLLRGVLDACGALPARARRRERTAGDLGVAAVLRRLLEQGDRPVATSRPQCGDHAGRAAADHDDVDVDRHAP
ncbi:MAG: hypothetical protein U0R76_08870 [Candidatus Nanopelagicales bacterium]